MNWKKCGKDLVYSHGGYSFCIYSRGKKFNMNIQVDGGYDITVYRKTMYVLKAIAMLIGG